MIKRKLVDRDFNFEYNTNHAIELFYSKMGTGDYSRVYALVYAGIEGYNYLHDKPSDLSFKEVMELVDTAIENGEKFDDLTEELVSTEKWKKMIDKGEKILEDEKKKASVTTEQND